MRGLRLAVLWAVPLLYAYDVCDEAILSEGIAAMADDLECVTDVKRCLQAGTCPDAGVSLERLCECFRKVEAPCGAHACRDARPNVPRVACRRCGCRLAVGSSLTTSAERRHALLSRCSRNGARAGCGTRRVGEETSCEVYEAGNVALGSAHPTRMASLPRARTPGRGRLAGTY